MKRFPSIKSNADFQRGYKRGRSFANACFVMYVAENSLDYIRLHKEVCLGKDIILVVRQSAKDRSYFDFEKAYLELCSRHHIIGREE